MTSLHVGCNICITKQKLLRTSKSLTAQVIYGWNRQVGPVTMFQKIPSAAVNVGRAFFLNVGPYAISVIRIFAQLKMSNYKLIVRSRHHC